MRPYSPQPLEPRSSALDGQVALCRPRPQAAAFTYAEVAAVRRLMRRLSPRDMMRQLAEALLRGEPPQQEAMAAIHAILGGRFGYRWRQAELAAWAIGRIPLDAARQRNAAKLLQRVLQLRDWPDTNARWARGFLRLAMTSLGLNIGAALLKPGAASAVDRLMLTALTCIPLAVVVLPISSLMEDRLLNRVRAAAVTALGHLRLPESTATLAETALRTAPASLRQTAGCRRVHQAALAVLPPVLLQLTPDHYGRLPASTVSSLCQLLKTAEEPLALDILEALGKVGDGSAVRLVERLAVRGRTVRLRDAAARILPTLRERQHQENAPKTLLRPACAPHRPVEILLRPADSAPATEAHQLLRASAPQMEGNWQQISAPSADLNTS
ncbi:MAG TPA: hypothetical protein VFB38_08820 [Chthonomonadaceae bacterium]|nr:hypothetical protein [Chthonomonadaceae bacterium]